MRVALAALNNNPDINVIYNMSDIRANGAMLALEQAERGTLKTELFACVRGNQSAEERVT